MRKQIMKVLDIAEKTYYNWKRQKRPIIVLLEEYFTKGDLEEYFQTGKIEKLEIIKKFRTEELREKLTLNEAHVSGETLRLFSEFLEWKRARQLQERPLEQ
ncbi:MAG: hypothetical protein U9Q62_08460 [Campylobacterota bacterium]|nr:hypothetical protein [Campylobacterota bacterium]